MRHSASSRKHYPVLILIVLLLTCALGPAVRAQDVTSAVAPADNASTQAPSDSPTDAPPTPLPATEAPATSAPTEPPTPAPTEAPATSQPTDAPTDVVTQSPTADNTTAVVTPETTATDSATQEVTLEATSTVVVTATSQPTAEATISVNTPVPTLSPDNKRRLPKGDVATEACTLNITDAGDTNAFTFDYAAVNAVSINSFDWDFGDGGTATGATASHTYASAGTYSVTLTCNAASGATLTLNGSITITSVVSAAFALSPGLSGYAPFTVHLTDTSIGTNLTYQWDVSGPETFSSTSPNPSFTFTQYGSYTIRLTVTDGSGQQSSAEATVVVSAMPPKADFTLSQVSGTPPLAVDINGVDGGQGPITSWDWSFGDGTTGTGQGPHNHTYTAEGTYTIVLNYSGPGGNGSVTKQVGVYALSEPVDADFDVASEANDPGGGVKVCFNNKSIGPIVTNEWDFGDGSSKVIDNSSIVCHVFASGGTFSVTLNVIGNDPSIHATATVSVAVVAAPQAQFTASSSSVNWGDTVDFDSSASTGIITDYAWDFNGDGTIDSTVANPSGIPFNALGSIPVRLTVTGPGGSSTAEMLIDVARRNITCNFTGGLTAVPGQSLPYDATVNELMGRSASYTWTVSGPNGSSVYTTEDVTIPFSVAGTYTLTFLAQASDGADCTQTKTVQVQWPTLTCSIGGPATALPNGSNNTYTASVGNLAGRTATYQWYVDGVLQAGTSSSFSMSWNATTTSTVKVVIGTTDGSGNCESAKTVTVAWPALTCSISGNLNPLPQLPDNPTRSYTYTASLGGVSGRTIVSYEWTVDGVVQSTTNKITLSWPWDQTGDYALVLTVVVDNGDGTTVNCSKPVALHVVVPALTCGLPLGDNTPVLNETVTFAENLTNQFGRTITTHSWELEKSDGAGGFIPVASGTNATFPYQFIDPGVQYRIRYSVSVTQPDESCTSAWQTIQAVTAGEDFSCDAWYSGSATPTNPAASYTYGVTIDNTNGFLLKYTWVLVDPFGGERVLGSNQSTIDGNVLSPAFSGANFSPADNYTLRVDVKAVNPADTAYLCSLSKALTVGTLTVDYTYNVNAGAVEVGQAICLTNISTTSMGDINSLSYTWDFGTASNSLNSQTSTAQQPGCLSYPTPGTYTITLTGTNASGQRSASKSYTFQVYGSQSIAINRSTETIAPANMSFSAVSVNVNAPYTWTFRNLTTNTVMGTRTGKSVTFFFNAAGRYEAQVSASGPLGVTTATSQFELIAADDIRAAFRPSAFGGLAPLTVCFTDRSVGNNITDWSWDFGNGQTQSYTSANKPSSICTTYTTSATAYLVTLNIKNSNGRTATATNVIRTFNLVEANATFTIQPQGSGRFCFTSQVDPGITVTEWEFGDGTSVTIGDLHYVCHTYQASGSYLVTMHITNGTVTGQVTRPVDVDLTTVVQPPNLNVSGSCSAGLVATFTVTNAGGDMTVPDRVTIRDEAGNIILVDDFLQLKNGQSKTYTVSGYYGTVSFSILDTGVSATANCAKPPMLSGASACAADGTAVFTISNSSPDTASNQSYEIRDASNNLITSGTLTTAANGGTTVIKVQNVYGPLTLSSSGTPAASTALNLSTNCKEPPVLHITGTCAVDGTAIFTVSNTSKDSAANQSYEIRDASNNLITSGTLTTATNSGSMEIKVQNVYGSLTFSSSGAEGVTTQISASTDCKQPPVLKGSALCAADGLATFTILNTSADRDADQTYEVRSSSQVVQAGRLTTPKGGMSQIQVKGVFDVLTLTTSGPEGVTTQLTLQTACADPTSAVSVSGLCTATGAAFMVNNTGRGPATQPYTIVNANGGVVQSGTLSIPGVSGVLVSVSTAESVTFQSGAVVAVTQDCSAGNPAKTQPLTSSAKSGTVLHFFPTMDMTPGAPDPSLPRSEPWGSITVVGAVCTDWLIYHTNMPGPWNIYRLGPLDKYPAASPNLSQGKGKAVIDMAPTRSPDAEWVAFTSNRDDNWELYIAKVDNSIIRRVTYNKHAKDIDPVWSPDGKYIAFESDRDGNWELYLLNVATGEEKRLTENTASDINAFWSADSAKIVFQSDRDGKWQVYEKDIATGIERRLSDGKGEDIDPAYSFNGKLVAFRSYRNGSGKSAIYLMNVDGTDVHPISDPKGNASNHTWYIDDSIIAYQSDLDGDLDIYVYELKSGKTRLVTDNTIPDYAPTWDCGAPIVVFTSDATRDPNIFNTPALPITAKPIIVEEQASQMTFDKADDVYPEYAPTEENASQEDHVPPHLAAR